MRGGGRGRQEGQVVGEGVMMLVWVLRVGCHHTWGQEAAPLHAVVVHQQHIGMMLLLPVRQERWSRNPEHVLRMVSATRAAVVEHSGAVVMLEPAYRVKTKMPTYS